MLILMNLFGFGLLYFSNSFDKKILYIGGGLLGLFMLIYTVIVLCRMGDKFIVLMACMLITIGVLLLCRINPDYGIRQIMWVAIGGAAFFAAFSCSALAFCLSNAFCRRSSASNTTRFTSPTVVSFLGK